MALGGRGALKTLTALTALAGLRAKDVWVNNSSLPRGPWGPRERDYLMLPVLTPPFPGKTGKANDGEPDRKISRDRLPQTPQTRSETVSETVASLRSRAPGA